MLTVWILKLSNKFSDRLDMNIFLLVNKCKKYKCLV